MQNGGGGPERRTRKIMHGWQPQNDIRSVRSFAFYLSNGMEGKSLVAAA